MASQQQLPSTNSARLAITSLCNVLRMHGVTCLEPETIRQAKFDGPVAGALWRGLHDTVLVVLAGCPACPAIPLHPSSSASVTAALSGALSRQWRQVELERAGGEEEEFPAEGVSLVLHHLASWGAPPHLLRLLQPHHPPHHPNHQQQQQQLHHPPAGACWRSRQLLLALGWLVAAAGLFEARIGELEPGSGGGAAGADVRALLPPYPQDSCNSPAVHAAYDTAASEARDHVQRLLPSTSQTAATTATNAVQHRCRTVNTRGDPFGPAAASLAAEGVWGEVEVAAQRAVTLCGRVRARLVTLQSATDCRHRLHHAIWARQAAASPSSRPLTPYELQLCANPTAVQRHMGALESATLALLEQQELAAHGELFFDWLGSVMEEEQQAQQQQRRCPGKQQGTNTQSSGASSSGSLASLEQLPYIGSTAGSRLAAHLEAQLQAAVQAAEPELSAARRRSAASTAAATPAGVSVQLFLSLAEQAVSQQSEGSWQLPPGADSVCQPAAPSSNSSSGSMYTACGEGSLGGAFPPLPQPPPLMDAAAAAAGPWRLPEDIATALTAVHEARRIHQTTAAKDSQCFNQLRYASLLRYDYSAGSSGGPGAGGPLAAVLAAAANGTAGGGGGAPLAAAADETQRLLAAVLAAARPLARTRAAHKAALLAALGDLPEGFLVAGV
ncbi:hypothetical protein Agub_g14221 [Astrephomene gubernaculifera]|uniref:Tubulin epsilon and delta complex protein 1 domain-containing protein n=1 Tax=Astrephomene gubernaculifera TaxID=47775 RepID=A0AAD3E146_9CHLO|nr:hypothetical protein Agub_g14221 [Astrephomene gubernaculifera]